MSDDQIIDLDFSDVQNPFELPPEDDYRFSIDDAEIRPSKDPAKPKNLVIKAVIVGGEFDGKKVLQWFHMGENSLWNLKLFLAAVAGEDPGTMGLIRLSCEQLVGQGFGAALEHDEEEKFANLTGFVTL